MHIDTLLIYMTVSFFYVISPGPAVFLAISNGMTGHSKAALASTLGNILGLFILSTVSMVGLGSIILASASLFLATKMMGAAYLIYLGLKQIKACLSLQHAETHIHKATDRQLKSFFTEGFLLAISNPKPILFFIAIFPQFLNLELNLTAQFFAMTTIFMFLSFMALMTYGQMAKSSKKFFKSKRGMAWFHRITGGLFIIMGLALLQLKNN